jgi:hypothetical protein
VPSFVALRFNTTRAAQDWVTSSSPRFQPRSIELANAPESYPPWPRTRAAGPMIRKATIKRFPYVIAFEKHEHHVLILAVAHARRRPLYWLTRPNP